MDRTERDAYLDQLRERADGFFARVQAARPEAITCHAGCGGCCATDLSVFAPEADRLRAAIAALPAAERTAAVDRARVGDDCALLDGETARCLAYDDRPLICRTHGLAVRAEGEVDACPLNYTESEPVPEDILVMERLTVPYSLLMQLSGDDGERVRIADLVLEA